MSDPSSLSPSPVTTDPRELRAIVLGCFAHAGLLVLSTAHVVRAFLLGLLSPDAPPGTCSFIMGLAHGTLRALELEGVIRGVRQFTAHVRIDDVRLCPRVARGVVLAEVQLLLSLEDVAREIEATAKKSPDVCTNAVIPPRTFPVLHGVLLGLHGGLAGERVRGDGGSCVSVRGDLGPEIGPPPSGRRAGLIPAGKEPPGPVQRAADGDASARAVSASGGSFAAQIDDEGDAECTGCGRMFWSGTGHPWLALCRACWKGTAQNRRAA